MFDSLSEKLSDAFKGLTGQGKISEKNIEETLGQVKKALLEADVNFKVVKAFLAKVTEKSKGNKVLRGVRPGEQFIKIMHDELTELMGGENKEDWEGNSTKVVMMVGPNGVGKTTFTGKLAKYLKDEKKKNVLLVPLDTERPAAKEQLQILANKVGVDCFDSDLSLDPHEIARLGLESAKSLKKNIVLLDTAGRLHADSPLMEQLKAMKNVANPHEVFLVADAMTGQEAVNMAKTFHEEVGLTGVVLSKMDSDTRGGAALSIKYVTELPLRYISVGENMEDLELFHPDRVAKRILDMGDVVSLVEKAEKAMDEKSTEKLMKNLKRSRFTIDDFMTQLEAMGRLGPLQSVMKMLPGMGGMMRQMGDLSPAEDELSRMKVMINSMTKKEKENYRLINDSRKNRIARGSGSKIEDLEGFLKKFQQMEGMMTKLAPFLTGGRLPNMNEILQAGQSVKKKSKGKKGKGPFGKGYF